MQPCVDIIPAMMYNCKWLPDRVVKTGGKSPESARISWMASNSIKLGIMAHFQELIR
jgi:hypothetical protein